MRDRINFLFVLGIAGIIFYFSVRPIPGPAYSTDLFHATQIYHAVAYFALAAALMLHFHDTRRGHVEAILTAAVFGACMEGFQFFLANRVFSVVDIALNMAGASVVLLDHRSWLVTNVIETEDRLLEHALPGET